ncbi:tetratricopeptide repeat protein, partial [Actinoplanes sp. NPDC051494]|uniref:tetratricopeptide repeat protein n=1 Tax=Actinoplanes sp. NPDC051494 TaxID=3363907 RepID=UPI0037BBAA3D
MDAAENPQPPDPGHVDARGGRGVQLGDGGTQHNYFSNRAPVRWPHRVGVVPPLADCRQPRIGDTEVAAASTSGQAVVVCQVVTGLGGVGKTQLAAGLAHQCWHDKTVDLLVWVTATSRAGIVAGYAQAAADVTGADDPEPEQAAARLLAWLAGTDRRWLIVLDDLSDPADLRGLWPPTTAVGRTVVTTRRRDAGLLAGRYVVPVGLFNRAEAHAYLEHKLAGYPHLLDDPDGLAADLGYLPLALAQAAAYLLDRELPCAGYRARLADRRRQLAELVPEDGALPDEHRFTVAATWALSIDLADRLHPSGVARPLIEVAALLDPNGIPATVFAADAMREHLSARRTAGRPVDDDDVRDGLHALYRLNLLTVDTDTVRVHVLVQRAVREATPADQQTATATANALHIAWPSIDHATTPLLTALRANTTALAGNAGDLLWHRGGHPLLYRAGNSLINAGLHATAVTYWQHMSEQAVRLLGDEHRDTLSVRANLAVSYWQAGRTAEAIAIQEKVLADVVRSLGDEHRDTLSVRANLAVSYWQAGRTAEAIAIR